MNDASIYSAAQTLRCLEMFSHFGMYSNDLTLKVRCAFDSDAKSVPGTHACMHAVLIWSNKIFFKAIAINPMRLTYSTGSVSAGSHSAIVETHSRLSCKTDDCYTCSC